MHSNTSAPECKTLGLSGSARTSFAHPLPLPLPQVRAKQLLKKAERLKGEAGQQLDSTWKTFQQAVDVLVGLDALLPESLAVMPLGLLARNLQARLGEGQIARATARAEAGPTGGVMCV